MSYANPFDRSNKKKNQEQGQEQTVNEEVEPETNKQGDDTDMETVAIVQSIDEQAEALRQTYIKRKNKKTLEETHSRATFLVKNELLDKMNDMAQGARGFKTEFINFAIELGLSALEEESKNVKK